MKKFLINLELHLKKEKEKARALKKTRWWRRKIERGICYYCGRKVSPQELTMDHRIPLSKGGFSTKENIVPSCKECNNQKKALAPWEWEKYLERLKRRNFECAE